MMHGHDAQHTPVLPVCCGIKLFQMQSQEGAALVEVQTSALFGDLKVLQKQMQDAVGQDASSIEELMQRVQVSCTFGRIACCPLCAPYAVL